MRWTDIAHTLAVVNLYFSLKPKYWMFEPREKFGKLTWAPDCLLTYQRKLYAVELQLTPIGRSRWLRKWGVYNAYFNEGHFHTASFQQWAKEPPIIPQFMVITSQQPETVKQGWEVKGRDLLVVQSL